jgi:hypothetical protein
MTRTTTYLTEMQLAWLRAQAERYGVTIGELVRRIIDEKREEATR